MLAVIIGAVLLVIGTRKQPVLIETSTVQRGVVKDEISSSTAGEVMPERKATVRAELSARVIAVKHQRGDRVEAGETVASLDAADLDARLRQAQATREAQRAQVAQAEARAETANRTADIAKKLAARGVQAPQSAEDAATQAREADAAVRAARAAVAQSEAALQVAKVARAHGALVAPFDGLLSEVFVDPGEQAQAGSPVFEIIDDARLHVEATVDEADIARVKVGQAATLRLDALPNQPIAGIVSKLDPTVRSDTRGARTLRIEVEVSDLPRAREAGVRPGMSANVDVVVAEKRGVLHLPTNVIIGRGTKRSVFVIEDGVARERPIETGIASWESTEILSGVREGDRVVATLNVKGLADGVPVAAASEHSR
jgi:HlyD family secretion protein